MTSTDQLINWIHNLPEEISEDGFYKVMIKWKTGNYTQVVWTEKQGIELLPKLKSDRKCIK